MGDIVWRDKCGGLWNIENCCVGCDLECTVVGTKVVKKGKRKRSAWWTEEVREVVKEKKVAYSII